MAMVLIRLFSINGKRINSPHFLLMRQFFVFITLIFNILIKINYYKRIVFKNL